MTTVILLATLTFFFLPHTVYFFVSLNSDTAPADDASGGGGGGVSSLVLVLYMTLLTNAGGETVLDRMHRVCVAIREAGEWPQEWTFSAFIPRTGTGWTTSRRGQESPWKSQSE